jgi:hypothetical protein
MAETMVEVMAIAKLAPSVVPRAAKTGHRRHHRILSSTVFEAELTL